MITLHYQENHGWFICAIPEEKIKDRLNENLAIDRNSES